MEQVVELRDAVAIEGFARRDVALHLYELGDLDPFFWPRTRWWGLLRDGELHAIALIYEGGDPPTLLALGRDDGGAVVRLLSRLREALPARVYAHLSPGLVESLAPRFVAEPHGLHLKMTLRDPARVRDVDTTAVDALGESDLAALQQLYARAYPGNWFDARMLATGRYYGVFEHDAIVCVAGVHVYAPTVGVAALGNVTTDAALRGRGLARTTTAKLCTALLDDGITAIGLNVLADNAAAIRCYERLGFVVEAEYDEVMLSARHSGSRS
jgi:ribosomal protein S18 acetylase RimI-like enzyme